MKQAEVKGKMAEEDLMRSRVMLFLNFDLCFSFYLNLH